MPFQNVAVSLQGQSFLLTKAADIPFVVSHCFLYSSMHTFTIAHDLGQWFSTFLRLLHPTNHSIKEPGLTQISPWCHTRGGGTAGSTPAVTSQWCWCRTPCRGRIWGWHWCDWQGEGACAAQECLLSVNQLLSGEKGCTKPKNSGALGLQLPVLLPSIDQWQDGIETATSQELQSSWASGIPSPCQSGAQRGEGGPWPWGQSCILSGLHLHPTSGSQPLKTTDLGNWHACQYSP